MYKYLLFLLTVISFQSFSITTQYVKVSQNSRSYTIPVQEGLTPEQILTKYRPTDPSYEVEGSWNKNKTSYSYKSFSGYKLCDASGGSGCFSFAKSYGYGLKREEGIDLESLVSENKLSCSDSKWKTSKTGYNKDKSKVQFVQDSCNVKDGEEPNQKKSCL